MHSSGNPLMSWGMVVCVIVAEAQAVTDTSAAARPVQ